MIGDEADYRRSVRVLDYLDRRLADRTASGVEALTLVLVPFLAAHVGLVHLYRATEQTLVRLPSLADAVGQVPSGLLGDAEVPVELHAGHTLEVGTHEIGREAPLAEGEVRSLHDRAGLYREVLVAVAAAEGLGLAGGALLDVQRAAFYAGDTVGPPSGDELALDRSFVREPRGGF